MLQCWKTLHRSAWGRHSHVLRHEQLRKPVLQSRHACGRAPAVHELRARVAAVPGEADAQRGGRRNGRHDAQRRAVRLQLRALLDVQLRRARPWARITPRNLGAACCENPVLSCGRHDGVHEFDRHAICFQACLCAGGYKVTYVACTGSVCPWPLKRCSCAHTYAENE